MIIGEQIVEFYSSVSKSAASNNARLNSANSSNNPTLKVKSLNSHPLLIKKKL